MSLLRHAWWWFEVHTGTVNEGGPYYGFFSGFGSDVQELAIFSFVITAWRHKNCHVRGCWRIGHRAVGGTEHVVCRKHHPSEIPTHEQVLADHAASR